MIHSLVLKTELRSMNDNILIFLSLSASSEVSTTNIINPTSQIKRNLEKEKKVTLSKNMLFTVSLG